MVDLRDNTQKVEDLFKGLNDRESNEYYTSYCKPGIVQTIELNVGSGLIIDSKRKHKDHNIQFNCNIIDFTYSNGYNYKNKNNSLLIAPAKTFFRLLDSAHIGSREFRIGKCYRISFIWVNSWSYELVKCEEIDIDSIVDVQLNNTT